MEWSENRMSTINYVGDGYAKQKAKFVLVDDNTEIPVQFNPSEYTISKDAVYESVWKEKKKKEIGHMQYQYTSTGDLNLTLYFDTSIDKKNVANTTKTIEKLAGKAKNGGHNPPKVKFVWGDFVYYGYVTSVKTTFILFTPDGIPIRAKMDVTMIRNETIERKNPPASPDRTKTRVMSEDISIWSLAQKEYDDVREWRRIAKANDIMNPFEIETGKMLVVPAIVKGDS